MALVAVGLAPLRAEATVVAFGAQEGLTDIMVCNRSGQLAVAAVSYLSAANGQFRNRGWVIIENGVCQTMASTASRLFYLYAEGIENPSISWRGNHNLCVEWPGSFDFVSTDQTTCDAGQIVKPFLPMQASSPGPHIWNLDPPN